MTIVAFVIAFVALLVAVAAIRYARRTVDGPGRATRVRQRMRGRGRQRAGPRFRLERISRHRYVLHNDGAVSAYDVRLHTGDVMVHEGDTAFHELPPGHREEYVLIQPMHGPQEEISVSWRPSTSAAEQITALPLTTEIVRPNDQDA
ncbi:hypothetical protein [Jiangella gansuensis]|uniref:hypothetical protein n=1 Tax=Jiangella gansuensis TaxID=281473 RepID=UPI000562FDC3|nr:hypothetical protein [Jiangella gansuensis]